MQYPCEGKTFEQSTGALVSAHTKRYHIDMGSTLTHEPETEHIHACQLHLTAGTLMQHKLKTN